MPPRQEPELEARVRDILEQLRPYLETDGVTCTLVRLQHGIAHVRLAGTFVGCATILMTLRMGIEKRLMEELPDAIQGVEIAPD
jgi:Fe-S cluster biogenesis protein NfuA